MKKFSFIFLFFLTFPLFSQIFESNDFHLSIEPFLSYSRGTIDEIIYTDSDKYKRSLLEWDRNIFLYGTGIQSQYKNFHLDLNFSSSIPNLKCGLMKDSDWFNNDNFSMKTTYSVGDNKNRNNFDISAKTKFDFKLSNHFTISPAMQFQYNYDSFVRMEAEGWYGQEGYSSDGNHHNWYDSEAMHFPSEERWDEEKQRYVRYKLLGIKYFRNSFVSWFGFDFAFILKKFSTSFSAFFSPLEYNQVQDTHIGGSILKQNQTDNFSKYKFSIDASYLLTEYLALSFKTEYLTGNTIKGDLYENGTFNKKQKSGSNSKELTCSFGVKFLIF
ncbi:MAG: omptin family outer membrane protease [Treponema sp.]|nr:omptin family outer membrane protease [Candidatus Treponema equifaecale]